MYVREAIQETGQAKKFAAIAIVVIGVGAAVWQLWPARQVKGTRNDYYSIDDGATWFADSIDKVPPFTHNGHEAVEAMVFKPASGKAQVMLLKKYSDTMKNVMESQKSASAQSGFASPSPDTVRSGTLVKRPGDKDWMTTADPNAQRLLQSVQASPDLTPVNP